ncbi:hypothetical protein NFI96_007063 [Prochilodus magdalenae]|nr:hypothetical protein NFI96_007063 [Prochilodus magdalenae]
MDRNIMSQRCPIGFTLGEPVGQSMGREAATALLNTHQGSLSVADYTIDFRTLAAESRWNLVALGAVYQQGLNEELKNELAIRDPPNTLEDLYELAIKLDNRMRERHRASKRTSWGACFTASFPRCFVSAASGAPEPVQIGRARLTPQDVEQRRRKGLCMYCGKEGHKVTQCPIRPGKRASVPQVRGTRVGPLQSPRATGVYLPIALVWGNPCKEERLHAFIDSGATGNFMDAAVAKALGVPVEPLLTPLPVSAIDRNLLKSGAIKTDKPILVQVGLHTERLSFFLTQAPDLPVILGFPWLKRHNPHIDWLSRSIRQWGPHCQGSCLQPKADGVSSGVANHSADLSKVPAAYHDLREVFSKQKMEVLPPHRAFDCAIDLLPGTSPPRGHLFSLSGPEKTAMERYIQEALAQGFIWPSTSPAGAGFFFVGKKDGGLCPCIDYRGLNKITAKDRYPLPLMTTAFETLQQASIFTKLGLRSAYNLSWNEDILMCKFLGLMGSTAGTSDDCGDQGMSGGW